jgi:uncharacterized protein (UPF0332 family)
VSDIFWDKGREAAHAARLLLDHDDPNGAADRAYFAMFHAARAALAKVDTALAQTKRHATVIRRFGLHLIKAGGLDAELGRALSLAFDIRTIADYEPVFVDPSEAREVVESAERFLDVVALHATGNQP